MSDPAGEPKVKVNDCVVCPGCDGSGTARIVGKKREFAILCRLCKGYGTAIVYPDDPSVPPWAIGYVEE